MRNKEFEELKNLIALQIEEVLLLEKSIETEKQFFKTIKRDFNYLCIAKVITVELIKKYKNLFAKHNIYANRSINKGFVLITRCKLLYIDELTFHGCFNVRKNSVAVALNNARIEAYGKSTIFAYDSAIVLALDNSRIVLKNNAMAVTYNDVLSYAFDNTKVLGKGNSDILAFNNSEIEARDNAKVKTHDNAKVNYEK